MDGPQQVIVFATSMNSPTKPGTAAFVPLKPVSTLRDTQRRLSDLQARSPTPGSMRNPVSRVQGREVVF